MPRRPAAAAALILLAGLSACATKQPKKASARPVVTKAAEAKAKDYYTQGVYAYAAGDTAKAMALWKKTLALDPNYQPALDAMKEARAKQKAVKALEKEDE